MRFSCYITKATNRQSEHVMRINFPRQRRLRERTSIRRYMHIACLVTYKERNGYWFCVCKFYMYCTALRLTGHSNAFISCTETGMANSLQLLGYVLCDRGRRIRFRLCRRLLYNVQISFVVHQPSCSLVQGALSLGVKRPGLQAFSYIIQCLGAKCM